MAGKKEYHATRKLRERGADKRGGNSAKDLPPGAKGSLAAEAVRYLESLAVRNYTPDTIEGRRDALNALLADPRVADPRPESAGARAAADPGQSGDPALDTAGFDPPTGNLRLSYVLPSRDLAILGSGVLWPPPDSDTAARFGPPEEWSRHRLVWVDLALP